MMRLSFNGHIYTWDRDDLRVWLVRYSLKTDQASLVRLDRVIGRLSNHGHVTPVPDNPDPGFLLTTGPDRAMTVLQDMEWFLGQGCYAIELTGQLVVVEKVHPNTPMPEPDDTTDFWLVQCKYLTPGGKVMTNSIAYVYLDRRSADARAAHIESCTGCQGLGVETPATFIGTCILGCDVRE